MGRTVSFRVPQQNAIVHADRWSYLGTPEKKHSKSSGAL